VPTPSRWIEAAFCDISDLRYEWADGSDVADTYDVVSDLAGWVRTNRRPAFLHLRTVRFMGHAGTDVESGYRSIASIRDDELRDPILGTARLIVGAGLRTPAELFTQVLSTRTVVREQATSMIGGPTLTNADAVMAPLSPRHPAAVLEHIAAAIDADSRATFFGGKLPESEGPLTLAETINRTLGDLLAARPDVLVFGEDVANKGGVYGVTRGLQKRAGAARVFDSLLDEQSILGIALGSAVSGLLPIPEIQYLAYLHNAEDQLRGEAASLSFFSQGRFRNPMVVRVAGLAYQKGFGGHFHNDNAIGVLRDIPGLVIACPGHPADAAPMLRTCVAAATADGTVSVFLEPIALYHTRDLHVAGDECWLAPYTAPDGWAEAHIPIGEARVARDGRDVLIVTWANGLHLSLRAAEQLAADGISCRVLDMRWLAPLPIDQIVQHANEVGRVVVVDETRRTGGVGEAVLAALVDHGVDAAARRVTAHDTFIPLGDAALCVLVSEADIVDAVRDIAARS
jgi:2-oxoisovalerate dehydrogenase E1 component